MFHIGRNVSTGNNVNISFPMFKEGTMAGRVSLFGFIRGEFRSGIYRVIR